MDALLGDDAENQDSDDFKGRVFASEGGELGPAHVGHSGDGASGRVVLGGIDAFDGALRVPIKKSDKLLHLLLCVAD